MKYVIQRSDGRYVANPGNRSSYVVVKQFARIYPSLEAANRDLCPENERAVPLANDQ